MANKKVEVSEAELEAAKFDDYGDFVKAKREAERKVKKQSKKASKK